MQHCPMSIPSRVGVFKPGAPAGSTDECLLEFPAPKASFILRHVIGDCSCTALQKDNTGYWAKGLHRFSPCETE